MKKIIFLISISLASLNTVIGQCPWTPVGPTDSSIFYDNFGSFNVVSSLALNKAHHPCVGFSNSNYSGKASVLQYNGGTWSFMGPSLFSAGRINYPSFKFSSSDTAYIAYQDDANTYKATVMKYNGASWIPVGTPGFSPKGIAYTSMVINSTGQLYVAYLDSANAKKATVMTYTGGSWVPVGVPGFSPGGASFTSLAISKADTLFIAFADQADTNKITVMKYNGTSWVNVGNPDFSAKGTASTVSLALDSAGTPYVAYDDGGRSHWLTVMKYTGAKWDSLGNRGFTNVPFYVVLTSSLLIDKKGVPVVAYTLNQSFRTEFPGVNYYNGSKWVPLTTPEISNGNFGVAWAGSLVSLAKDDSSGTMYLSLGDNQYYTNMVFKNAGNGWSNISVPAASTGYAVSNSLALNSKGVPYIAYQDGNDSDKITVRTFNGSNWVNVGNPGFSAGMVGATCMAFGPKDTLYAAYLDVHYKDKVTVMKYNGSNWVGVGLPGFTAGAVGVNTFLSIWSQQGVSMVFDKSGAPCVCYVDSTTNQATVMRFNGSTWVSIGTGTLATQAIIARDSVDSLYVGTVSYGTQQASVLKYNGSSWNYIGSPNFSYNNVTNFAFTVSANGTPYAGCGQYPGFDKFIVKTFNGSKWVFVGDTNDIIPGGGCGAWYPYLATDNYGTPYLTFQEYGACGPSSGPVLRYVGTSKWQVIGFPLYTYQIGLTEIAFDATDTAFVSYAGFGDYVKKTYCPPILTSESSSPQVNNALVSVYPNPNNGDFTLSVTNYEPGMKDNIEIYNMLGEKLYTGSLTSANKEISLKHEAKGLYLYRVISQTGELISSGKFIIQ